MHLLLFFVLEFLAPSIMMVKPTTTEE